MPSTADILAVSSKSEENSTARRSGILSYWPSVFGIAAGTLVAIAVRLAFVLPSSPKTSGSKKPSANPQNVFGEAGQSAERVPLHRLVGAALGESFFLVDLRHQFRPDADPRSVQQLELDLPQGSGRPLLGKCGNRQPGLSAGRRRRRDHGRLAF